MADLSESALPPALSVSIVRVPRWSSRRTLLKPVRGRGCNGRKSDTDRSQDPGSASVSECERLRVFPLTFQFLLDAVQDSVNELRRFLAAEASCNFDRLVNDDALRRFFIVNEFLCREAKKVAVDDGHTIQT